MKKYLLNLTLVLALSVSCSDNKVKFNIEIIAENLPDTSKIYITGNDDQLGNWQPDFAELEKNDDGKWERRFSFEKGKKLEFKITRGSWEKEALNDDGSIPSNHSVQIVNDTIIKIKVSRWTDQIERKTHGQITGKADYYRNFSGVGLKPRDIIVWMPSDYDSSSSKKYSVLYMHDGQNIVDPTTSTFQVDWQLDEAADSLIKKEMIEPIIIVGIYNTPDRDYEYSEDELGYAYMKFIVDSLKPFIDRNYKTLADKNHTANGGGSLGGLIAFILAWEYPDVFSKAMCFSPAFNISNYNFVDNVSNYNRKKKEIQVYINIGDDELDTSLQPSVDQMINALESQGFVEGINLYSIHSKNAQHRESDWARSVWQALIFLFGTEKGRNLL